MSARSSATPQGAQDEQPSRAAPDDPLVGMASSSTSSSQPVPPGGKCALLRKLMIRGRSVFVKQDSGDTKALRQFGRKTAVLLGICASVAEAVPALGATVKGALEAAIKVQAILEQRFQNTEAIQRLVSHLQCLEQQLDRYPKSDGVQEAIERLGKIENVLRELATAKSLLDHEHVALCIADCEKDLSFVMGQCSLAGHAETQMIITHKTDDLAAGIEAIRQQGEMFAVAFECRKDEFTTKLRREKAKFASERRREKAKFEAQRRRQNAKFVLKQRRQKEKFEEVCMHQKAKFKADCRRQKAELEANHRRQKAELEADHRSQMEFYREMNVNRQGEQGKARLALVSLLQSSGLVLVSLSIRVIDPFGTEHVFLQVPSSFEALGRELLNRYASDRQRRPILEHYVRRNLFDLSRMGQEVSPVAEKELATLEKDSTLIMSIIMFSERKMEGVECPLCRNYIVIRDKTEDRVLCQTCNKNVQVVRSDEGNDERQANAAEDDFACFNSIVIKAFIPSLAQLLSRQHGKLLPRPAQLSHNDGPSDTESMDTFPSPEHAAFISPPQPAQLDHNDGSSDAESTDKLPSPEHAASGYPSAQVGQDEQCDGMAQEGVEGLTSLRQIVVKTHGKKLRPTAPRRQSESVLERFEMLLKVIPPSDIVLLGGQQSQFSDDCTYHCFAMGGFSDVYKGVLNLGTPGEKTVAIKVFRLVHRRERDTKIEELYKNGAKRLHRQYAVWGELNHRNILPLEGLVDIQALNFPGLVSEFKRHGNLLNFMKNRVYCDRLFMAQGIACGLEYLHSKDVVHCNLIPDNILVDQDPMTGSFYPLITGFGMSRVLEKEGYAAGIHGIPMIIRPPELLENCGNEVATNECHLTPASDVYSLSLIILLILTGKEAYSQEKFPTWLRVARIMDGTDPLRPVPEKYPLVDQSDAFCWPLMQACWRPNPEDRITSREAHHWLCTRSPLSAGLS